MTTLSPDQRNLGGGFSAPRLDTSRWPDLTRAPSALKRTVHARVARRLFEQAARRLDVRVELPDGTATGRAAHVPNAPVMVLHRPERFLERLGAGALIGFGESYMAGDWDSPDLGALLTVFAERMASLVPEPLQKLRASTSPGCRGPSGTARTTRGATSAATTTCPTRCSNSSSTRR